jgi:hypothetical protein
LREAAAARCCSFTLRDLIIALALPIVKQSGQTQTPARSNPPRKFGKRIHQQQSLPAGTPQLNLVPQCSQISFSIKNSDQDGQVKASTISTFDARWTCIIKNVNAISHPQALTLFLQLKIKSLLRRKRSFSL